MNSPGARLRLEIVIGASAEEIAGSLWEARNSTGVPCFCNLLGVDMVAASPDDSIPRIVRRWQEGFVRRKAALEGDK